MAPVLLNKVLPKKQAKSLPRHRDLAAAQRERVAEQNARKAEATVVVDEVALLRCQLVDMKMECDKAESARRAAENAAEKALSAYAAAAADKMAKLRDQLAFVQRKREIAEDARCAEAKAAKEELATLKRQLQNLNLKRNNVGDDNVSLADATRASELVGLRDELAAAQRERDKLEEARLSEAKVAANELAALRHQLESMKFENADDRIISDSAIAADVLPRLQNELAVAKRERDEEKRAKRAEATASAYELTVLRSQLNGMKLKAAAEARNAAEMAAVNAVQTEELAKLRDELAAAQCDRDEAESARLAEAKVAAGAFLNVRDQLSDMTVKCEEIEDARRIYSKDAAHALALLRSQLCDLKKELKSVEDARNADSATASEELAKLRDELSVMRRERESAENARRDVEGVVETMRRDLGAAQEARRAEAAVGADELTALRRELEDVKLKCDDLESSRLVAENVHRIHLAEEVCKLRAELDVAQGERDAAEDARRELEAMAENARREAEIATVKAYEELAVAQRRLEAAENETPAEAKICERDMEHEAADHTRHAEPRVSSDELPSIDGEWDSNNVEFGSHGAVEAGDGANGTVGSEEMMQLRDEIAQHRRDADTHRTELARMSDKLASLRRQLEHSQLKFGTDRGCETASEDVDSSTDDLKKLREEMERHERDCSAATSELSALRRQLDHMKFQCTTAEDARQAAERAAESARRAEAATLARFQEEIGRRNAVNQVRHEPANEARRGAAAKSAARAKPGGRRVRSDLQAVYFAAHRRSRAPD